MTAVQVPIIEPVIDALTTSDGWIGLLLGLGGRETAKALKKITRSIRGGGGQ